MLRLEKLTGEHIGECAAMYAAAYGAAPWCEQYDEETLKDYFARFVAKDAMHGYVLLHENEVVGLALCSMIPSIGQDFLRIEDFCIKPERQKQGLGSAFIDLLCKEAASLGADCVLLNTEREFPSHAFYVKNGFTEVGGSVMLVRDL